MVFEMRMREEFVVGAPEVETFTEASPPRWLLGGAKGSTMDNRWFFTGYVLTLPVGGSVDTDFRTITRVQ